MHRDLSSLLPWGITSSSSSSSSHSSQALHPDCSSINVSPCRHQLLLPLLKPCSRLHQPKADLFQRILHTGLILPPLLRISKRQLFSECLPPYLHALPQALLKLLPEAWPSEGCWWPGTALLPRSSRGTGSCTAGPASQRACGRVPSWHPFSCLALLGAWAHSENKGKRRSCFCKAAMLWISQTESIVNKLCILQLWKFTTPASVPHCRKDSLTVVGCRVLAWHPGTWFLQSGREHALWSSC